MWPSNSPGYIPRHWKICPLKTCTQTFRAPLLIIAQKGEQSNCLLADGWINMVYICTTEYFSAIKRNEVFLYMLQCGWPLKAKDARHKRLHSYDSIYMNCLQQTYRQRQISGCLEPGEGAVEKWLLMFLGWWKCPEIRLRCSCTTLNAPKTNDL